jgi:hypothetical protein
VAWGPGFWLRRSLAQRAPAAPDARTLAIKLRGLLVILAMGGAVLPARRDVIRKQDEALAYLQKCRTLGRIACHLGGVRAGLCFLQIDTRVCHDAGNEEP